MHAFIKDTTVPAIIALPASCAISDCRLGARPPREPITVPMEPMLAKPQRAYVEIMMERS